MSRRYRIDPAVAHERAKKGAAARHSLPTNIRAVLSRAESSLSDATRHELRTLLAKTDQAHGGDSRA